MRHRLAFVALLLLVPAARADMINPIVFLPLAFGLLIVGGGIAFGINFLINRGVIYVIDRAFRGHVSTAEHVSNGRVAALTGFGLIIDVAAAMAVLPFFYLTTWVSMSLEGAIVALVFGLTSYGFIFRKHYGVRRAIIASGIIGIVSNPFWFRVVMHLASLS